MTLMAAVMPGVLVMIVMLDRPGGVVVDVARVGGITTMNRVGWVALP